MYVNSTSTDTFLTYPVIWFLVLLGLIQPEKKYYFYKTEILLNLNYTILNNLQLIYINL